MLVRVLFVLGLTAVATAAHADAIDPSAPARVCPPMTCPPGSHPVGGGHSGCPSECGAPTACDDEHPCAAGSTCTPAPESLCIESVSFGNYEASVRRGPCVEGACPTDQSCWTGRYCVADPAAAPPPPPPAPTEALPGPTAAPVPSAAPSSAGGLCSASVADRSPALGWLAVLAVAGVGARRRAR